MYIIVAILAFGVLIATHELGHFLTAKSFGVKVNEFSIGMGPVLLKKQGKETQYSLRLLPIGGFCAMEGEDGESEEPRAFVNQKAWKKLIVLIAGSAMNFLTGLLIVSLLYTQATAFATNQIAKLEDGFELSGESGLMEEDTIYSINGHRIFYSSDFATYMARASGAVDLVIIRDGEKLELHDFPLAKKDFVVNGETVQKYGITFSVTKATFGEKINYSLYTTYNFMRYVQIGLSDLVRGAVGVKDMQGVVGIVSTIQEVGESSGSTSSALQNIAYFCAFLAINLAMMNMLPVPALDGGRVFLLLVTLVIEKIIGKKVNPKIEQIIHAVGFALLMALMVFVMFNDVVRIVNG